MSAPAFVFYEALEAFVRKEWSRWGFRKIEVRAANAENAHVEIIAVLLNVRKALGEKGCEVKRLQIRIEQHFGFNPGFVAMYLERWDPYKGLDYEDYMTFIESQPPKGKGKSGKSKGRGKGKELQDGSGEEDGDCNELADFDALQEPAITKGYGRQLEPRGPSTTQRREGNTGFTDEQYRRSLDRLLNIQARLLEKESELPIMEEPMKQQKRYALRIWRELSLRMGPMPPRPDVPREKEILQKSLADIACDDWGAIADDWGAPISADWGDGLVPTGSWDDCGVQAATLTSSSAKTSKGSKVCCTLGVLGSSEKSVLELKVSATVADALEQIREVRGLPKKRELQLILMPSGEVLNEDYQIESIPDDEELTLVP